MVSNKVRRMLAVNKMAFLEKRKSIISKQIEFYKRTDVDLSKIEPEFAYEKHPDFVNIARELTLAMKEQELADIDAEIVAQEENIAEYAEDANNMTG